MQPPVTCAPGETSYSSFWVGLDGDTTNTVEQIGTDSDCIDGTPTYSTWYELYPKKVVELSLPLTSGDPVTASVQAEPGGAITLTLSTGGPPQIIDATDRHADLSSAEVIAEALSSNHGPFGTLPLANFGTVQFSNVTVNGEPSLVTNGNEITMQIGTTVRAQPTPLSDNSFDVTRENA